MLMLDAHRAGSFAGQTDRSPAQTRPRSAPIRTPNSAPRASATDDPVLPANAVDTAPLGRLAHGPSIRRYPFAPAADDEKHGTNPHAPTTTCPFHRCERIAPTINA